MVGALAAHSQHISSTVATHSQHISNAYIHAFIARRQNRRNKKGLGQNLSTNRSPKLKYQPKSKTKVLIEGLN